MNKIKLLEQDKKTISEIIDRLIEEQNVERGDLLGYQNAVDEAKKLLIDYVVEGKS